MAKAKTSRRRAPARPKRSVSPGRWLWRWLRRLMLLAVGLVFLAVALPAMFDPPTTPYIAAETRRLGAVKRGWAPLEDIAPVMARSVVAAEDANFCLHWGFDMVAIRAAIEDGASRGASTISQQVVKNVYLWQGRSWIRKALEALLTPLVELVWSKRRIVEVYLNVAEFGDGVFGVRAAALQMFGVPAKDLSPQQAALLAALLPAPKQRSATAPTAALRSRARQIRDGAATIEADGRAGCFQAGG